MANYKYVLIWESSGVFVLIIVGSLLHFVYDWSNQIPIIGVISPVNESVWEHLKLGFWSLALFSLIEYWFVKVEINNFLLAKGLGILALQASILFVFYTYNAFLAGPILVIDISSYVLGCVLCQVVSYVILTRTCNTKMLNLIGLAIILIHIALLIIFTFKPPRLPIFQDSHSLTYGIQWKNQ